MTNFSKKSFIKILCSKQILNVEYEKRKNNVLKKLQNSDIKIISRQNILVDGH